MAIGFGATDAAKLAAGYTPDRIRFVLDRLGQEQPPPAKPTGWVIAWLRKSQPQEVTETGRLQARLDAARKGRSRAPPDGRPIGAV